MIDKILEDVYAAMLARPQASLTELQEELGIPLGSLRRAVVGLNELALIRQSGDNPEAFLLVDPEKPLQSLIAREAALLAAAHQRLEETRVIAARLVADFAAARPQEQEAYVKRLDGIGEIKDHISALCREGCSEVMTLAPRDTQGAASIEAGQDAELLGRGVRMRTVYLDSMRNDPATKAYTTRLVALGGEVRTTPSLPIGLMILGEVAVLPLDSARSQAGAMVLTGNGVLVALRSLFEKIWQDSVPFHTKSADRDKRGLSRQEAEALRLLGEGLTDQAIARKLGVSPRTARRISAELMQLLDARSRFQAGVRAMARGWVEPW
ncbi:helix-turn-helix transcriptional regulator [Nonomuraea sp. NPDC050786]|uniref:helix-turn-helix transcriptional regulator n=1 Tax=Nonomuraea sp. NPDC050786 TaxID=3154840 RepID=UPI0033E8EABA